MRSNTIQAAMMLALATFVFAEPEGMELDIDQALGERAEPYFSFSFFGDSDDDEKETPLTQARVRRAPAAIGNTVGDAVAGTGDTSNSGAAAPSAPGNTGGNTDTSSGNTGTATSGNTGSTGTDANGGSSSGNTGTGASTTDTSKNPVGIIVLGKPITRDIGNLFYWPRGGQLNMTWSCRDKAAPGTVSIWVQRMGNAQGGGGQLTPIARKIGNNNAYSWNIPENFTVGSYMVFVEDDSNNVISNTSLMSDPSKCQPFSSYSPQLVGIYQRLDYKSLLYLVSAAPATFVAGGALAISALACIVALI